MNEFKSDPMSERIWYTSFCSNDEIDRIISPQNANDFLLQERANIVADHTRFLRVYLNKAMLYPQWSFEKSFSDAHYLGVLKHLSAEDLEACKNIAYGDMFSDDVNGYARSDPNWGRIICLNESLQFFMKFCNLALLDFNEDVPLYIRFNALRIAMRVMMKAEAMDFFMDPRGIVPKEVGIKIHAPIRHELQFIAGHEFAHHICGHLDDKNVRRKAILTVDDKEYFAPVYNVSQMQEFEADIASLVRPQYSSAELCDLLDGTLLWFTALELSEIAQNIMCPTSPFAIKTHPSARERFNNILESIKIPREFDRKKIERIRETIKPLGDFLADDISMNYEVYEFYGSVYLDAPNTKWRGRELIDRVDY